MLFISSAQAYEDISFICQTSSGRTTVTGNTSRVKISIKDSAGRFTNQFSDYETIAEAKMTKDEVIAFSVDARNRKGTLSIKLNRPAGIFEGSALMEASIEATNRWKKTFANHLSFSCEIKNIEL
jgi:hypothetical protein